MSWLYLPVLVGESSGPGSSGGEQSAPLKTTPTGKRSCSRAKRTASSILSRSGRTLGLSTDARGVESWRSSLLASRASRSALPDDARVLRTNATSGLKPSESFAKYDRDTHCWKMCLALFPADTLEPFSGTWPKAGLMLDGACSARMTLAPTITESGSGYFPTPYGLSANQGQGDGEFGKAIRMWPTPSATEYGANMGGSAGRVGKVRPSLSTMARRGMWPTPMGGKRHATPKMFKRGNPALAAAVKLWPTPASRDWRSGKASPETMERNARPLSETVGGQLNPTWVEWLMNWPMGWTDLQPLPRERFNEWLENTRGLAKAQRGSAQVPDNLMRPLWWDNDPSQAPLGFQPEQQRGSEHRSSVRQMPHEQTPADSSGKLRGMQQTISAETQPTQQTLRESAVSGDAGRTGGAQALVPRVATGIVNRQDRIAALGDGQVPLCAATAWQLLVRELLVEDES